MSRTHGRLAALLAALVLGVLVAGCAANHAAGPKINQSGFARLLRADQEAAGRGVLGYRPLPPMTTGMTRKLIVSVTAVGRYEPFPIAFQQVKAQDALSRFVLVNQDVPTGGYVGVKITDCVHLSCHLLSITSRQPVVQLDHPVYWSWAITATHSGVGSIVLDEVLYREGSQRVLKPALPIQIQVHIKSAPVKPPGWFSSVDHVLITIGAVVALLAGIVTGLGVIFGGIGNLMKAMRRRTKASDPDPKAEQESTAARAEQ